MNLVAPSRFFFENTTSAFVSAYMVSPAYYDKVGPTEIARSPMGTGPFRFVE